MKALVSSLSEKTVEFPPMLRRLAQSDGVGVLERLRVFMQGWCRDLQALEAHCDRQLAAYLHLTSPLAKALQLNNSSLIDSTVCSLALL